jgi:hypothetical protein
MCTVSFVYSGAKTIITSNRDEQEARAAYKPDSAIINNKKVFFPKDPKAGGTWFAIAEHGAVVVLLNGASGPHIQNPPYRKSRGIILLEIISSDSPIDLWFSIDLENIEPFTLVIFHGGRLFRTRWNGFSKETLELDPKANHIWSSAMLYPEDVIKSREVSFYQFVSSQDVVDGKDMMHFHSAPESAGAAQGFVIERDFLKTISITQTIVEGEKIQMHHKDLVNLTEFSKVVFP